MNTAESLHVQGGQNTSMLITHVKEQPTPEDCQEMLEHLKTLGTNDRKGISVECNAWQVRQRFQSTQRSQFKYIVEGYNNVAIDAGMSPSGLALHGTRLQEPPVLIRASGKSNPCNIHPCTHEMHMGIAEVPNVHSGTNGEHTKQTLVIWLRSLVKLLSAISKRLKTLIKWFEK
ncbi:uncharacterized protein LOC124406368 [Diprion similis]|uniref:uncharacterized protein LOC124406368 n=1 Tax=Diprion similis TaxID=362088 RepID=UPI001EF8C500|nr:uncharacterized protein LOC124406368 [Diprion similis]